MLVQFWGADPITGSEGGRISARMHDMKRSDRPGWLEGLMRVAPGVSLLTTYERQNFRPDLLAALGLWALLIPQGLAYAQLAGLAPVTGLYAGLVAVLAYALFGTSRYLTVGPESSVAILVASSLAPLAGGDAARYAALAATLAVLTAAVLLVGFLLRLGVITRLLSSPILTGYLAGSAIVMALNQLPRVFGFEVDKTAYPYVIGGIFSGISETNSWAIGLAVATVAIMLVARRISKRLPAGFIAMAGITVTVWIGGLDDRVSVLGDVPSGLPTIAVPSFAVRDVIDLLIPAASIALLVFSGSLLTAQALAARDQEDVDANREFAGLAAANAAAGLVGGFPTAGSDSRSFLVASSGGRTQMVGMLCGVMVALTLLFLTPLFTDLPDAALGAAVLVTASQLLDFRAMRTLWSVRRTDFVLMIVTFVGVLAFGVLGGIIVGVITSLSEMVRRTVHPRTAVLGMIDGRETWRDIHEHDAETIPGLLVYRFDSPLFFGNADVLRDEVRDMVRKAEHPIHEVVVNAEAVTDLDTTGVQVLDRLLEDLSADGVLLQFARVRAPIRAMMMRTGFEERLGKENLHYTVDEAVEAFRARRDEHLEQSVARHPNPGGDQ